MLSVIILHQGERSEYDHGVHSDVGTVSISSSNVDRIIEFLSGDRFPNARTLTLHQISGLDFKHFADQGLAIGSVDLLIVSECDEMSFESVAQVLPNLWQIMVGQGTKPVGLESLAELQHLEQFTCNNNLAVTDLHGLEFCHGLRLISCTGTRIRNIEWLAQLLPNTTIRSGETPQDG